MHGFANTRQKNKQSEFTLQWQLSQVLEVKWESSQSGKITDWCTFQMLEDPDELAVLEEIQQELILQGNVSTRFLTPIWFVVSLTF